MAAYLQRMTLTVGGALNSDPISLSDANAQRIITAHRQILGLPPASTAQEVWAAIARRNFDMLKADSVNYERRQSEAAVVVPEISET